MPLTAAAGASYRYIRIAGDTSNGNNSNIAEVKIYGTATDAAGTSTASDFMMSPSAVPIPVLEPALPAPDPVIHAAPFTEPEGLGEQPEGIECNETV